MADIGSRNSDVAFSLFDVECGALKLALIDIILC